jgi:hypothetical protein
MNKKELDELKAIRFSLINGMAYIKEGTDAHNEFSPAIDRLYILIDKLEKTPGACTSSYYEKMIKELEEEKQSLIYELWDAQERD